MEIPESVRTAIAAGPLAHLVTINTDGSPQVSIVWVGVDGDHVVSAHLSTTQRKLRNVRRDPRVVISMATDGTSPIGLDEYIVLHGNAQTVAGGAPELLQKLAYTYIGPDVVFPPMPNPPPGAILRTSVTRISGVGPWAE